MAKGSNFQFLVMFKLVMLDQNINV